ncbi:hypothetical protein ID866_8494 [Astraeus odoratus]|nr:hypothetical protein ID866_8494 [Astraeus odoratus]
MKNAIPFRTNEVSFSDCNGSTTFIGFIGFGLYF